jgi:hypothetical protein
MVKSLLDRRQFMTTTLGALGLTALAGCPLQIESIFPIPEYPDIRQYTTPEEILEHPAVRNALADAKRINARVLTETEPTPPNVEGVYEFEKERFFPNNISFASDTLTLENQTQDNQIVTQYNHFPDGNRQGYITSNFSREIIRGDNSTFTIYSIWGIEAFQTPFTSDRDKPKVRYDMVSIIGGWLNGSALPSIPGTYLIAPTKNYTPEIRDLPKPSGGFIALTKKT